MLFFFLRFDSETHEFDPDESTFSIPTNEVKVDDQLFFNEDSLLCRHKCLRNPNQNQGSSQTVGKII